MGSDYEKARLIQRKVEREYKGKVKNVVTIIERRRNETEKFLKKRKVQRYVIEQYRKDIYDAICDINYILQDEGVPLEDARDGFSFDALSVENVRDAYN